MHWTDLPSLSYTSQLVKSLPFLIHEARKLYPCRGVSRIGRYRDVCRFQVSLVSFPPMRGSACKTFVN